MSTVRKEVSLVKKIENLVDDIYGLFTEPVSFKEENVEEFGRRLGLKIANRVSEERGAPALRLSNLGSPCDRQLWYRINKPERAEPLPAPARIKFLFGDILEELLLFLAKEAGHTVEGEQDEVDLHGIKGHRDAVIDGRIVDVKSASTFAFKKFETHTLPENDSFGYMAQLGGYLQAGAKDESVKDKDTASFLAIDKTLGKIVLDTYKFPEYDYYKVVEQKKKMLSLPVPPKRAYTDVPEGKSGNYKLGVACSYCPFKQTCWPDLRAFAYSSGPVFLTRVAKLPQVAEIKEYNAGED